MKIRFIFSMKNKKNCISRDFREIIFNNNLKKTINRSVDLNYQLSKYNIEYI